MQTTRTFEVFLARAHRRRLVWRAIEHAGIGLLSGAAVAGMLLPAICWRGIDAPVPTIALLIVGGVAGLLAAISRVPNRLDTAMRVEETLGCPQLISSAILARESEPFAAAVRSLADARVRDVSIAALTLRRLNSRAWSGIALATATVVVVALMISAPIAIVNDAADAAAGQDEVGALKSLQQPDKSSAPRADPVSADGSKLPGDLSLPDKSSSARTEDRNNRSGSQPGSGIGSSKTDQQLARRDGHRSAGEPGSDQANESANGSGRVGPHVPGASDALSTVISKPIPAPVWSSPTWPADCAAANDAMRAGSIPDAYRALVRDYFDGR